MAQFQRTVCENGIRVISEKIDSLQSVSIGVWVCSGSRDEPKEQNGISHLLEHMVFKGTRSRTAYEIAEAIEWLGGYLNAFTEKEFVCYYVHVLDDNLAEAIDLLGDVVQYGLFDENELVKEKRIIFEEIQSLEDTPEDFIQDRFVETVFDRHALGFPTLGSYESIREIRQNDLIAYRKRFYTFDNIIVAAAGKVNHKQLVAHVYKTFDALTSGSAVSRESFKLGSETFKIIRSPVKQSHVCTGMTAYGYRDPHKYGLLVLNALLGSGMSSRLFQNLREKKGLAYSVYSFLDLWSDTGLIGIYVGTSQKSRDQVLELIDQELFALGLHSVSQDELEKTKNQLTRHLILMSDDCTNRMNRIAKMEAYTQNYIPVEEMIQNINGVSAENMQQVVCELVEKRKRYTTVLEAE